MADLEIAKHTKKVYKIWNSREHGFWHKFREFFLEIIIIVFAVSVSIWFHNLSEKSHDKKEAKEYLLGLKTDLLKDIDEMREDSLSYAKQLQFFGYLIDSSKITMDTSFIKSNIWMFNNRTVLVPNVSRFEALKYSGKMNIIENKELLDEILNLYEEKIPSLINNTVINYGNKEKDLLPQVDKGLLLSPGRINELINQVKNNDTLTYQFRKVIAQMPFIIRGYHAVINQNIKLISLIDEEIK